MEAAEGKMLVLIAAKLPILRKSETLLDSSGLEPSRSGFAER